MIDAHRNAEPPLAGTIETGLVAVSASLNRHVVADHWSACWMSWLACHALRIESAEGEQSRGESTHGWELFRHSLGQQPARNWSVALTICWRGKSRNNWISALIARAEAGPLQAANGCRHAAQATGLDRQKDPE